MKSVKITIEELYVCCPKKFLNSKHKVSDIFKLVVWYEKNQPCGITIDNGTIRLLSETTNN